MISGTPGLVSGSPGCIDPCRRSTPVKTSGCIVWGQYHSSDKVSCDKWYARARIRVTWMYRSPRVNPTCRYIKTRRWECDRTGVEPTSSGCIVCGLSPRLKRSAVISDNWNPSSHISISGYMCGARRVVRGLAAHNNARSRARATHRSARPRSPVADSAADSYTGSVPSARALCACRACCGSCMCWL